jgi:predicted ATPase/DNA-binding SARP family transcriptional activator
VRFCDLGPLQIEVDGEQVAPRGRRLVAILSTLLLHLDRRVSVDLLLDAVWADEVTAASTSTLETHIWRLRRTLEPHRARGEASSVLLNDSGGYRLVATSAQVDSARFEQLNLDVLDLLTTDQPARALQAAELALGLWRGDPFLALADRAWAAGPVHRLAEIRTQLHERRVDAIMAVGQPERAVAELVPLLARHPFRERLWWQRMLALYRSGRTEDALAAYRTARRTLLDEVGLEPGPELAGLHRRILDQDPSLVPTIPTDAGHRPGAARQVELRLPRPRPMVGRGRDLHAVGELLKVSPLITVAGAAGCGKTLLATETARLAGPQFPDGVRFVDLSAADHTSDVAELVAAGLDLPVPPGAAPLRTLAGYATDRRTLLVLDNCEQLLDQVAALADTLTGHDRQLSLLITSREPLGIPGEEVHTLEPLAVSSEPDARSPFSSTDEPAVALFAARARLPTDLLAVELATIRQICRAVDGIPLAIELAAALGSTFSLAEIADQVERDPGQLAAIGRGQARHHQTLSSAIDRSFRLLSEDERVLHRRLSVLPGSFGRELAEAVVGPDLRSRTASLLARLVHRSLLTVTHHDGVARFAQLSPVRAHAAQALRGVAEVELAERLRDEWTRALIVRRPSAGRPEEADWYDAVALDLPTLRATLHRRLVTQPDRLGLEVIGHLPGFWYYLDLVEEGIRWTEAAWAAASGSDLDGVISRLSLADLLALQGRADRSRALVVEALALIAAPDGSGLRLAEGDLPLTAEQQHWLAELILSMTSAMSVTHDLPTMRRLLDLLAATGLLDDDQDLTLLHAVFSCLVDTMPRPDRDALGALEELFRRADEHGNLWAAWAAASIGAMVALTHRDPDLGFHWSRRVIDRQGRLGARTVVSQVETFGDFLALAGRHVPAVRIFAATHHQSRQAGRDWPRNGLTAEMLDACRAALSSEDFAAAWAVGPTLDRTELTREDRL